MNRLMQLLSQNRRPFEPVQNKIKAEGGKASIYLYDPIVGDRLTAEWWGGICPQDFVPALRALEADEITLYTNCPGGDVFAAEAMCQALREHPAKVTMQIEGYAASAATAIACACDEVVATPGSMYMIHQTWTFALGNADDLMKTVELLQKCDNTMYDQYTARTGKSREQVEQWCKDETWFTADEAKANGFIDVVLSGNAGAKALRNWNLSAYAKAPQQPEQNQVPEPKQPEKPEPNLITDEHRARQQQRISMLARI